jgi:crotonobetainyl-CoA:carnitine CoA-transferase CaiB-like acyl-CoA transferase
MAKPLDGFKIVDLTTVLMGPFATQILGDMGAEVVKVEALAGDPIRAIGPLKHDGMGPIFLHSNRSKRSIALDLKRPEGRDAFLQVCAHADALVYNVRPQAMRRLRLGYADVATVNPSIVYAGLVGYGPKGDYAEKPAYDDLIQGAVALPSLYAKSGGEQPRYVPITIADHLVGISGAAMILGALLHRARTGEGQELLVPMFETVAQVVLGVHLGGRTFDPAVGPPGYARLLARERRPYRTRDGYLCALLYSDEHCRRFFDIAGRTEQLNADERYSSLDGRNQHADDLYRLIAEVMLERTTADWVRLLGAADVPVMPLHDLDTLLEDAHLNASGLLQWTTHPTEGLLRTIGFPSTWSRTQPEPTLPVPRLGEHSVQVLREAGLNDEQIDRLLDEGIVLNGA